MSEQLCKIKYRCLHESCQIKICREGELTMEESLFAELSASYEDEALFKSPRGICRMGFPQVFKVISPDEETVADAVDDNKADPISILKEDHQGVLRKLDLLEEQIGQRDIDALWITSAELENDITLHSIEKEEGVLFPLLENASAISKAQIAIIREDHRELFALIHSFRTGLREGHIIDEIANSVIANIRSHIDKEDEEFFESVGSQLDAEGKRSLLEGMVKAVESHVVIEAGDRSKESSDKKDSLALEREQREQYDEALLAVKDLIANQGDCGH